MSPPQRGNIEVKEVKETQKGKKYGRLEIGGETYTTWDLSKISDLRQGDTVDFSFKESDGGFKNLTFITKAKPEPALRDTLIARQVALKSATELVTNLGASAESRPNSKDHRMAFALEVIDIANLFDRFFQETGPDDYPPEPEEPSEDE